MEHSGMHRRLAAVLTASLVGGTDSTDGPTGDSTGSNRLRELRVGLIEPAVAAHEGRVVENLGAGDLGAGMLAEFVTAVEALRCAIDIQRALRESGDGLGKPPPLQFRLAENLGDVFAEGGAIRGDGVAIARRIEHLARPGGICITRTVLGQVKGQVGVAFEDLGAIEVKNIPEPVHVFEVLLDPDARHRQAAATDLHVARVRHLRDADRGEHVVEPGREAAVGHQRDARAARLRAELQRLLHEAGVAAEVNLGKRCTRLDLRGDADRAIFEQRLAAFGDKTN